MHRYPKAFSVFLIVLMITMITLVITVFAGARAGAVKTDAALPDVSDRGLTIVFAATQPTNVREVARQIAAAVQTSPLLQVLANGKTPSVVSSADFAKSSANDQGFNHIVLVGMPDDPVIQKAWLRDARVITGPIPGKSAGMYVFGFGNLLGDIGYIESDRNPFLHSIHIKQAPYETEIITVSGSSPAGIQLAANALLKQGLVNGVIADSWHRGETTILDRDPLKPGFTIGDSMPMQVGEWKRIGITQAGEDEYRGVLADAGIEPSVIWRGKFYQPGVWDAGGTDNAIKEYAAGLHRRSYCDMMWVAQFSSDSEASSAAEKIAAAAHLTKAKDQWVGKLGTFAFEKESAGPLTLAVKGSWVMMSTVPAAM